MRLAGGWRGAVDGRACPLRSEAGIKVGTEAAGSVSMLMGLVDDGGGARDAGGHGGGVTARRVASFCSPRRQKIAAPTRESTQITSHVRVRRCMTQCGVKILTIFAQSHGVGQFESGLRRPRASL